MRVRVHQMLVALPLTLVSALGIAVAVQSFSLESADLLAIAPADSPLPLDAIRGSVDGAVPPPPPARPVEPAPAVRGITGFTAPAGAAPVVAAAPAPKVKVPAARTQSPKPVTVPRGATRDPNCRPADTTMHRLPTPTGSARRNTHERAVSGPASGTPLLPGSVPARNSAGLPGGGSSVTGLINRPSTSRPGPSTSGPGPSISQPSTSRPSPSGTESAHSEGIPDATPFADAQQVGVSETAPQTDGEQIGTPGPTPQVADCSGPGPTAPGRLARRRVPTTEPVVARDGGLTTPARSGW